MHRGATAPYWIITAWIGIPGSGAFLLPSRPKVCRGRPRPCAGPARCQRAWPAGRRLGPPVREGRRRNWEGRRAFVSAGPHGAGTYYMGRLGGQRGWRGKSHIDSGPRPRAARPKSRATQQRAGGGPRGGPKKRPWTAIRGGRDSGPRPRALPDRNRGQGSENGASPAISASEFTKNRSSGM